MDRELSVIGPATLFNGSSTAASTRSKPKISVKIREEKSSTSLKSKSDEKLVKIQQNDEFTMACCYTDGLIEITRSTTNNSSLNNTSNVSMNNKSNNHMSTSSSNNSSSSHYQSHAFYIDPNVHEIASDLLWYNSSQLLCSSDKVVHLYDLNKNKPVTSFRGHAKTVYSIAKNVYNNMIATAGAENVIVLWDARVARPINVMMAHSRSITSVAFASDSMSLASCGADGFTRVFSTHTGLCRCTLNSDTTSVPAYAKFADNNAFLLVDTLADKIQLWDWHQQDLRQVYENAHNNSEYLESFFMRDPATGKQRYLLGYSDRKEILLWDILDGNLIHEQTVPTNDHLKLYQKDGHAENGFYLYGNDSHEIFKFSIDITSSAASSSLTPAATSSSLNNRS